MSIRDILKQREAARDSASSGDDTFPEGVTRYVRMGRHGEVNADGRALIMLADPDNWYVYFVHEDKEWNGKGSDHKFQKHTCSHSPKGVIPNDELVSYFNPNKDECLTCKVMKQRKQRKMFFIIPVYDPEYKTYRVLDVAEFHANNLIADYDKAERPVKRIQPEYTLVGQPVHFKQDGMSYALETGDAEDAVLEEAKEFIGIDYGFEDLANFREEDDIIKLLHEAEEGAIKKNELPGKVESSAEGSAEGNANSDDPENDGNLPF